MAIFDITRAPSYLAVSSISKGLRKIIIMVHNRTTMGTVLTTRYEIILLKSATQLRTLY